MIYFMQPAGGGPVKIGFSENIDARRKALEAHYRKPLAVLATFDGGRDEEREMHERFAHLRFGRTEQFRPAPDLMAFIGRPLLVGANPEAVEAMAAKRTMLFELTPDVHRMLRKLAADENSSMASFARESLEKTVREEFKKRGLK